MAQILWLVPNKPDNISTGRQRIADGLRERGHDVTLTQDRRNHASIQASNGFDLLMSSSAAGGLFGPPAKAAGKKFIMDHVDPISQMYRTSSRRKAMLAHGLQNTAFRLADGIFYVYDEEEPRVTGHSASVEQTTLGVDYQRFATTPKTESLTHVDAMLSEEGVEPGFAVYIGGFEPIYRIPDLLKAAADGGWPLVLAGCGHYDDFVERSADKYDNITHLGVVEHEHVPALLYYAGAGICLVDDPHTVKVLEYAAAGLPIVHAEGRAEGELPSDAIHWVPQLSGMIPPKWITMAVRDAFDDADSPEVLRDYAREHDYQAIIDQYDGMVREVTGEDARRAVVQ